MPFGRYKGVFCRLVSNWEICLKTVFRFLNLEYLRPCLSSSNFKFVFMSGKKYILCFFGLRVYSKCLYFHVQTELKFLFLIGCHRTDNTNIPKYPGLSGSSVSTFSWTFKLWATYNIFTVIDYSMSSIQELRKLINKQRSR